MADNREKNKARHRKMQNLRPTIGLLTDEGMRPLNRALWAGIDATLRERGANLVRFPGCSLRSPVGFQAQANVLYDLITAENVDGLVIWGAVLARDIDLAEMKRFCERYRPLPMVNIGLPLEGVPSVLLDNYGGMRDAVLHLTEIHGSRRIAYVRGPEGHPEADERYRAYTDVLAEHGLPFDPDLVAPGSFDPVGAARAGVAAIPLLLDERKADFEAIVAANDTMALGAMEALQGRGMRVPGDVAVVGFNDQEGSGYVAPPLTTVPLQIWEQGRRAAEVVLALLAGEGVPERVVLPTKVVVRQSCGCAAPEVVEAAAGLATATGESFEAAFATRREEVLSEIVQVVRSPSMGVISEQAERLLDVFSAELKGESPGIFLSTLGETLRQMVAANGDVAVWQEAISTLRRHALPCLGDVETRSRAEDLWQQARVVIAGTAQRAQAYQRLQEQQEAETLREIAQELSTTFDVAKLMGVLARELPRLGIPRGYLSLYEEPQAPTEWSHLTLAYDERGRLELPPEGWRFPSRQLVPTGLLPEDRRYRMVVDPLHFRENQLGVALFEVGQREERVCEALRSQISSALRGALLMEERKRAEEALKEYSERLEEMVEERTKELRDAQDQLIRQEKLAVLGQMAGGVGHDLRNPLGAISNAAYFLNMALEEPEPEVKETLEILQKEVKTCERIISSLLDFARAKPPTRRKVNINDVVQEALSRTAVPENVEVVSQLDEALPIILADPDQLGQVFGNIILNAVQAMAEGGRLVLKSETESPQWVAVSLADTGVGIPEENLDELFEPLFTTKAKGVGLGLAVVKSLVEGHGGTIGVQSKVGKGSTFTVRLPTKEMQA